MRTVEALRLRLLLAALQACAYAYADQEHAGHFHAGHPGHRRDHWSYKGKTVWPSAFPSCGGHMQSPINIDTAATHFSPQLMPLLLSGYSLPPGETLRLHNNGHTIVLDLPGNMMLTGGGFPQPYQAAQLHLHWGSDHSMPGSEHTVDGHRYAGEIHVVHYSSHFSHITEAEREPGGLAVLAAFLEVGPEENEPYQHILEHLEDVHEEGNETLIAGFDVATLLPNNLDHYFRYNGSLTTPPCYQTVNWTIFNQTIRLSQEQCWMTPSKETMTSPSRATTACHKGCMAGVSWRASRCSTPQKRLRHLMKKIPPGSRFHVGPQREVMDQTLEKAAEGIPLSRMVPQDKTLMGRHLKKVLASGWAPPFAQETCWLFSLELSLGSRPSRFSSTSVSTGARSAGWVIKQTSPAPSTQQPRPMRTPSRRPRRMQGGGCGGTLPPAAPCPAIGAPPPPTLHAAGPHCPPSPALSQLLSPGWASQTTHATGQRKAGRRQELLPAWFCCGRQAPSRNWPIQGCVCVCVRSPLCRRTAAVRPATHTSHRPPSAHAHSKASLSCCPWC
ncbi:carbonic anhydrase 9 isoform X1 [Elgaria multicarinata webbii]|uniref:carbonic anhydrase 9 isoform X1 n=1 Tax=Elgaria multicarinata webbii TaxID=159646 RepID=UPI002FCD560F